MAQNPMGMAAAATAAATTAATTTATTAPLSQAPVASNHTQQHEWIVNGGRWGLQVATAGIPNSRGGKAGVGAGHSVPPSFFSLTIYQYCLLLPATYLSVS